MRISARSLWLPLVAACLSSFQLAPAASAVTMDWTFVGDPGNAGDGGTPAAGFYGEVLYTYNIGTYEVTNAQYAEFLNAKAAADPLGLYNANMGSGFGGITRSGSSGSYTYSVIAGRENMPVNHVSFYDALRFANWLNNGQATGDTETGAYLLLGGSPTPSNGASVTRDPGATIFLESVHEWYKAAYYDASSASYFNYPAASDTATTCSSPTATPNRANCDSADLTDVGSYAGSPSPYGTFDQGGNVMEWNEESPFGSPGSARGVRGGSFLDGNSNGLDAQTGGSGDPTLELGFLGFRVAMIPEPGTGLLVITGLLGLAGWRRVHA